MQARVGSSLVSRLGNLAPEAIFETPFSQLAGWVGISEKAARAFDELQRGFDARAIEHRLVARGIEVLTLADDGYPRMLRNIPDPPPALYVHGAVPETVSVALVGSRKASTTGVETARTLGLALAERGICDGGCARVRHRRYVAYKIQTMSGCVSALGSRRGRRRD